MFGENTFLLWQQGTPTAWIIDPGLPPQAQRVVAAVRTRHLTPAAILLTHCHGDHIAGAQELCEQFHDCRVWAPKDEAHMLGSPTANLSASFGAPVTAPEADRVLSHGESLQLERLEWRVLDVSGHSPGGLAFYCQQAGVVFTGDALFSGSIGRVDFPGSSGERLLQNIARNLLTLPPETVVYSGHGPATTIGDEALDNPFLTEVQQD
jgi:glyoxylase-like metal-dependent hydrolase (beta-lactamase superfamily II)